MFVCPVKRQSSVCQQACKTIAVVASNFSANWSKRAAVSGAISEATVRGLNAPAEILWKGSAGGGYKSTSPCLRQNDLPTSASPSLRISFCHSENCRYWTTSEPDELSPYEWAISRTRLTSDRLSA